jgi:hypothetical protein
MLHLNSKAEIQIVLSWRPTSLGGSIASSIAEPVSTNGCVAAEDGENVHGTVGTNGKGGEGRENPLVAYLAERMGRPVGPEGSVA